MNKLPNAPVPAFLKNQKPIMSSVHSTPYDPFVRPADGVSIEEWRIMICSIAGRFRLSQGFTRTEILVNGQVVEVAQNDKSYALFVFVQRLVGVAVPLIASGQSNVSAVSGVSFTDQFEQVLLPGESLYVLTTAVAGTTLAITEVTV